MKSLKRKKNYTREKANIGGKIIDWSKEPISFDDKIADKLLKNFPDRYEEVKISDKKTVKGKKTNLSSVKITGVTKK